MHGSARPSNQKQRGAPFCRETDGANEMAVWFFIKKSKGEPGRDSAVLAFVKCKGLAEIANKWKDGAE